jgi:hypothetical protein
LVDIIKKLTNKKTFVRDMKLVVAREKKILKQNIDQPCTKLLPNYKQVG